MGTLESQGVWKKRGLCTSYIPSSGTETVFKDLAILPSSFLFT